MKLLVAVIVGVWGGANIRVKVEHTAFVRDFLAVLIVAAGLYQGATGTDIPDWHIGAVGGVVVYFFRSTSTIVNGRSKSRED